MQYVLLPEFGPILSFIDSIFAQVNLGLLIYHAEEADDPSGLRLIYANREANACTGTDLQDRVGRRILDAFPALGSTRLPEAFLKVVWTRRAVHLGAVEYGDEAMGLRRYGVRAFPMPAQCVGILFEDLERSARQAADGAVPPI